MVKKKVSKKKTTKKKTKTKSVESILIQNSIEIQKVMVKLIERFDRLSTKIEDLLELFEDSAKALVKKEIESGRTNNFSEELLEKINKLTDQNRVIAKGLTLIHEDKAQKHPKVEIIPHPNSPYPNIKESEIIPGKKFTNLVKKPQVKEQEENPVFKMPE